jgi:parallel beta-helix repeat protein
VAPSGNDANPGSFDAPWRTLQKAANSVGAGATVYVRAGAYAGFTMANRSGTASAPITFSRYPGDARPKLDGQNAVQWVVKIDRSHHIRITGFEVTRGYVANTQDGGGILVYLASNITVSDSELHNNSAYGVRAYDSTYVTIENNDIHNNGQGVDIRRGGEGVRILNNDIHDQDRCMGAGTCAVGVGFVKSTGRVLAQGNRIWGNRAQSVMYGWDGGGFEIYGASNVTMTENFVWDSDSILETGTDSNVPCANNVFTRNVAWGSSTAQQTVGLLLRCAENMLVAHNTIANVTYWTYDINLGSSFSHRVDGLRIVNNIHIQNNGKIYGFVGTLPMSTFTINHNLDYNPGRPLASVPGRGYAYTLADLNQWTGFQANGINADPRVENVADRDFRLKANSPAIDRGTVLNPWSSPYNGSGPDLGYDEY